MGFLGVPVLSIIGIIGGSYGRYMVLAR